MPVCFRSGTPNEAFRLRASEGTLTRSDRVGALPHRIRASLAPSGDISTVTTDLGWTSPLVRATESLRRWMWLRSPSEYSAVQLVAFGGRSQTQALRKRAWVWLTYGVQTQTRRGVQGCGESELSGSGLAVSPEHSSADRLRLASGEGCQRGGENNEAEHYLMDQFVINLLPGAVFVRLQSVKGGRVSPRQENACHAGARGACRRIGRGRIAVNHFLRV